MAEEVTAGESTQQTESWTNSLPEDIRGSFKDFSTQEDANKAYVSLVSKIGQNPLVKPKDDAGDDAKAKYMDDVFKAAGRPDSVDGYDFVTPDGTTIDDSKMSGMKELAMKSGLSADQFNNMVSGYLAMDASAIGDSNDAHNNKIAEIQAEFDKTYGDGSADRLTEIGAFANENFGEEFVGLMESDSRFVSGLDKMMKAVEAKVAEYAGEGGTNSTSVTGQGASLDDLNLQAIELSDKLVGISNRGSVEYKALEAQRRAINVKIIALGERGSA